MIEILMALEDEFGLDIPDDETDGMRTVGEAIDYITERL